jgi:hypothetical protein
MYQRYWCRLHTLNVQPAPSAGLPVLCRTFLELLQVGAVGMSLQECSLCLNMLAGGADRGASACCVVQHKVCKCFMHWKYHQACDALDTSRSELTTRSVCMLSNPSWHGVAGASSIACAVLLWLALA